MILHRKIIKICELSNEANIFVKKYIPYHHPTTAFQIFAKDYKAKIKSNLIVDCYNIIKLIDNDKNVLDMIKNIFTVPVSTGKSTIDITHVQVSVSEVKLVSEVSPVQTPAPVIIKKVQYSDIPVDNIKTFEDIFKYKKEIINIVENNINEDVLYSEFEMLGISN
jgi:hypothetical protein